MGEPFDAYILRDGDKKTSSLFSVINSYVCKNSKVYVQELLASSSLKSESQGVSDNGSWYCTG